MCGIVGYIGPNKNPISAVVSGLKKLEYRGYDSAGVAFLANQRIEVVRAEGKLQKLETKLSEQKLPKVQSSIGHTRWATHGEPSERNAHPHRAGRTVIVHNGIIENHKELKAELKSRGVEFHSDTDSEVIAHLIDLEMSQKGVSLFEACQLVYGKLRGAFSVLALSELEPDRIVGFKFGPPLLIGVGEGGEFLFASDALAVIEHTQRVLFMQDGEIAEMDSSGYRLAIPGGAEVHRSPEILDWNPEIAEKQGFSHFMLKEIFEQPRAFQTALSSFLSKDLQRLELNGAPWKDLLLEFAKLDSPRVVIVACGTSYYAGCVAKYWIETLARIPVEVDLGSEYRYRSPILPNDCLFLTISQSGETADTLAALRLAKELGANRTLTLCNSKESSLVRESAAHIPMGCGVEVGVASTKALMSSLTCLMGMAALLATARKVWSEAEQEEWVQSILLAPSKIEAALNLDSFFAQAADSLKRYRGFLYMGRGEYCQIALEGALKMKELAYLHAEGYAAGEMKHGPLALVDSSMCVVMVSPRGALFEKTMSNMEEVRARQGKIVLVTDAEPDEIPDGDYLHVLQLPKAPERIQPFLSLIPIQLMAFHLANHLGHNVDQPRNLAKSVTVE